MAESAAAGLGDEKETDNDDKVRTKRDFQHPEELTETLGCYERRAKRRDSKRRASGESEAVTGVS